jgi:hypothetical protein
MRCLQDVFAWMTKRLPEPATHHHRHSGARSSREPGIHNREWGLWIPGPRQKARPGMTGGGHGARAPLPTLRIALASLALLAFAAPASAQGKLDARYEVTLAGIPVGKGAWVVDIADDQYSASASGGTSGLLKAFASGSGTGGSQGRIVNGALVPQVYSATVHSKKSETIRISLAAGNIKEFSIEPEPPVDPDRIPLTDAHRRGVVDPMTGSLLRVPGAADPLGPEACRAGGGMRYELKLDYKRMEHVRAEKGYAGPAVVCAVYFTPVAGYIPDRAAIKWLAAQRHIEAWFAPIAGTRILVPFRMMVPTPLGMGVLEATQFVTQASPPRVAKSQ